MVDKTDAFPQTRWYNSLIFRVVLLCVVLLLCLLGSVYVITRYYFGEVVKEMEAHTRSIVESIELRLEEHPEATLDEIENEVKQMNEDMDVEFLPFDEPPNRAPEAPQMEVFLNITEEGQFVKEAWHWFALEGKVMLLKARVELTPQTEVLRAFKNKFVVALILVFVVALGLMVYFIVKLLRPLNELSESCGRISRGELCELEVRNNFGEVLALERTFNEMVASLREKEVVEANLRQAQRLSALGTLAAGVAHDVRNPLNAIKLLSSHALDAAGEGPASRHLKTIRNEVDRLEKIVSSFLSLAKEREVHPEPAQVDVLLNECVRLVQKDAEIRGVRLITELRAGDTTLMLDPKQWTRAVLNVLINALEACSSGGRVRVFSRVTDTACEVEVRDDGPGLSKETIERAFDPYFTTKTTGTGLGLSITRAIVEEHGGTVSLSGEEGQGCQVLFLLPLETMKVDAPTPVETGTQR
jgi:signal transduction histidine kinase